MPKQFIQATVLLLKLLCLLKCNSEWILWIFNKITFLEFYSQTNINIWKENQYYFYIPDMFLILKSWINQELTGIKALLSAF